MNYEDIWIEDVARKHYCHKCKKIMQKGVKRVQTLGSKYCLFCGLKFIRKKITEWTKLENEIREKYGKKIIVDRLKGE